MAIQRRWKLLACATVLAGVAITCAFLYGRFGNQLSGGNPMNVSHFTVEHVHISSDKPFDDVTKAFEAQLGRYDQSLVTSLLATGGTDEIGSNIEAMVGPSGFMLFGTRNHGALLRLAGQKRKAVQYVVGNPLFAIQMTQHDIRASLYAPLRVLIYQDGRGKTCVEYDRPSSSFGQFGKAEIAAITAMLDQKLERLVSTAIK